eukprot:jgi/Mesvir1/23404/Mv21097-RA.1
MRTFGGDAGGAPRKGRSGGEGDVPVYERQIPKFLQKYSHLMEKGGFQDDAAKAWAGYSLASKLQGGPGASANDEDDDWGDKPENAPQVVDLQGLLGSTSAAAALLPSGAPGAIKLDTSDPAGRGRSGPGKGKAVAGQAAGAVAAQGAAGILDSATPEEVSRAAEAASERAKEEGNKCFNAGDQAGAVAHFTDAIKLAPGNHVLYSNRSAAHAARRDYKDALADAKRAVELKPDWAKGYSRLGAAYAGLEDFEMAAEAYGEGLKLDPDNEVMAAGREKALSKLQAGKHTFRKKEAAPPAGKGKRRSAGQEDGRESGAPRGDSQQGGKKSRPQAAEGVKNRNLLSFGDD